MATLAQYLIANWPAFSSQLIQEWLKARGSDKDKHWHMLLTPCMIFNYAVPGMSSQTLLDNLDILWFGERSPTVIRFIWGIPHHHRSIENGDNYYYYCTSNLQMGKPPATENVLAYYISLASVAHAAHACNTCMQHAAFAVAYAAAHVVAQAAHACSMQHM